MYLCGYRDEQRQLLSDATCTALQLANFWQDVSRDLDIGRIYIPLDAAAAHGVSERDIVERRFDERYVGLKKDLIARTRALFAEGQPLAKMVDGRLSVDLEMFTRGGLAVLDAIEAMGYDTLHHRPAVSKVKQAGLLARALVAHLAGGNPRSNVIAPTSAVVGAGVLSRSGRDAASADQMNLTQSYEECHRIARASHSNFYYAFFLLPKPKRDGLAALYAFMRLVDDVADEGADLAAKQRGLAKWRAALDEAITGQEQLFDGTAATVSPVAALGPAADILPSLVDTMQRHKMPARYLHDLISGAEIDLTVHTYPTFDRLREYCYRVAGTVGLTCTHVFGFSDARALDLAEKLGLAFQLTNIIRDVHEDYKLGRVYLPEEDLQRYGVSRDDFARGEATLGVRELLRFETERASAATRKKISLKSVIVIGGGLAGLAAGVALAESGWRVRLFEQRPFLGGRATSYVLPDGQHVDNCQHVTLGCCTNLEDFYRRVGCADKIKFFDRLLLIDPQRRVGRFQAGLLPAPFHILGSFASFSPLSLWDKLSIGRAMLDILQHQGKPPDIREPGGISMLEWLRRRSQTERAIHRFWRVVLICALSEELERIDARYGVDVFWKTVLLNRTGYRMGIPSIPLAALYDGCKSEIERRGGEVILRAPVRGLKIENGDLAGVRFDEGREESADAYLFAVPHIALAELLPQSMKQSDPSLANLDKIKVAPITGVHFWFDRPVMKEPFVTLLDTTTQWIFNKTALYGDSNGKEKSASAAQYLQLVISASYDLLQKPRQEIGK